MNAKKTVLCSTLALWAFPATLLADETDDVMAKRGDGMVTHYEFDAAMERIPEEDRGAFLRSGERFEQMVSNLLLYSQLAAAARKKEFDADPLVQARMKLAAEKELANAWLDSYVDAKDKPDLDALAREYYVLHPGEFTTQKTLDVSHVLVSNQNRSNEEARALAEEIRAKAVAEPESFEALVAEYSEDPSASSNQGRFPSVTRGSMVRPFEEAAFAMAPGEISQPVYTQFGYHVIRVNAINEPRPRAFEEVREQLVRRELKQHRERVRLDYLAQLSNVETELTMEDLQLMLSRYFSPEELATFNQPE